MIMKLKNGENINAASREDFMLHIANSIYPAADAVNALSENMITESEYYSIMRKIMREFKDSKK